MTVTAVVPTKNRPAWLVEAVRALLAQSVPPDTLIVVDQSDTDTGRRQVTAMVESRPGSRPALVYVWDPAISGLAAARNVAIDLAREDVIVFCDDDVVAEASAIERLLEHYGRRPDLAGIAPVITNYVPPGRLGRAVRLLFCRGPFRDERQPVYWFLRRYPAAALVPVRMFTGAMMSFRREALRGVRLDPRFRGASVGEDIDLCWTVHGRGGRLAMATDARIVHHRAPRPAVRPEAAMILSWAFLYDKHVPKTPANRLAFAWYVVGVVVGALWAAVRERTLAPIASTAGGVRGLFTNYATAPFLAAPAPRRRRPAQV
jgi:GT2 family glycosyltransferase